MKMRFAVLLLGLAWPGMPALAQGFGDKMEYAECMRQSRTAPRETLAKADAWARAGGGLPAEHCVAASLLGIGEYERAATRLDDLVRRASGFAPALRAELAAQAGSAWLSLGKAEKALKSQSLAIDLDGGNAEHWIDRSITLAGVGAWKEAVDDLSNALRLAPRRADILILRAAAWRNLKDWNRSRTDVDAALAYDPDNPEALTERGYLRLDTGNKPGADADFRRALLFAQPDSAVAKRARDGLAQPAYGQTPRQPRR